MMSADSFRIEVGLIGDDILAKAPTVPIRKKGEVTFVTCGEKSIKRRLTEQKRVSGKYHEEED